MSKEHPLSRKENSLNISSKTNSSETSPHIRSEIITKSIADTSNQRQDAQPQQSITTTEGDVEKLNKAEPATIAETSHGIFLPLGDETTPLVSKVLFDKDNPVGLNSGSCTEYIQFKNESPSKQNLTDMLQQLNFDDFAKPLHYSKIELNTVNEIAQIENNVRMNNALAMLNVDSDMSFDSDNDSDDAQRFCDDDEYFYASSSRPIYSNKPLMNNRTLSTVSDGSLIAVLDFNIGDDDSQVSSTMQQPASTR